jgi:hypothetical protein
MMPPKEAITMATDSNKMILMKSLIKNLKVHYKEAQ